MPPFLLVCWTLPPFCSKQQNHMPLWLVKVPRDARTGNYNFEPGTWFPIFYKYFCHSSAYSSQILVGKASEIIFHGFPDPCYPLIEHGASPGWWSLKLSVPAWCLWRPGFISSATRLPFHFTIWTLPKIGEPQNHLLRVGISSINHLFLGYHQSRKSPHFTQKDHGDFARWTAQFRPKSSNRQAPKFAAGSWQDEVAFLVVFLGFPPNYFRFSIINHLPCGTMT